VALVLLNSQSRVITVREEVPLPHYHPTQKFRDQVDLHPSSRPATVP